MTLEPVRESLLRRAFHGRAMRNVSKTQAVDPLAVFDASELGDLVRARPPRRGGGHDGAGGRVAALVVGRRARRRLRRAAAAALRRAGARPRAPRTDTERLLRVQGGTRIREVNELLDARGLALANMGGYDGQTFAGVMSTATHGTGVAYGPLASFVALDRSGRRGRRRAPGRAGRRPHRRGRLPRRAPDRVLEQDDALFAAVQVGMGLLGIVHSVTIEAVPAYRLCEKRRAARVARRPQGDRRPRRSWTHRALRAVPVALRRRRDQPVHGVHPHPDRGGASVVEQARPAQPQPGDPRAGSLHRADPQRRRRHRAACRPVDDRDDAQGARPTTSTSARATACSTSGAPTTSRLLGRDRRAGRRARLHLRAIERILEIAARRRGSARSTRARRSRCASSRRRPPTCR